MIGKLKGIVDSVGDNSVLLDVNGVCYNVFISGQSRGQIPDVGQAVSLVIETHVREDHIHLYGFVTQEERQWFNTLTTVKGVGTKMALSFLSTLTPAEITLAIASGDAPMLTRVNGVGKKLAERAITELKDKVGSLPTIGAISSIGVLVDSSTQADNSAANDAISALVSLGYDKSKAYVVISKIVTTQPELNLADLIRIGLKEI